MNYIACILYYNLEFSICYLYIVKRAINIYIVFCKIGIFKNVTSDHVFTKKIGQEHIYIAPKDPDHVNLPLSKSAITNLWRYQSEILSAVLNTKNNYKARLKINKSFSEIVITHFSTKT